MDNSISLLSYSVLTVLGGIATTKLKCSYKTAVCSQSLEPGDEEATVSFFFFHATPHALNSMTHSSGPLQTRKNWSSKVSSAQTKSSVRAMELAVSAEQVTSTSPTDST